MVYAFGEAIRLYYLSLFLNLLNIGIAGENLHYPLKNLNVQQNKQTAPKENFRTHSNEALQMTWSSQAASAITHRLNN